MKCRREYAVRIWPTCLLGACLFIAMESLTALESRADSGTDWLATDDLDFASIPESQETAWYNDFKLTFEQRQSQARGGPWLQRSQFRWEYARGFAEHWYIQLDSQHRYFWQDDEQARQQGSSYDQHKIQQAWVQYSEGTCAAKLGRQTLIWGEVEGTFAVDVVSPFDFTEQLLTDYRALRLPQDMLIVDCFHDDWQWQSFVVAEARTNITAHYRARQVNDAGHFAERLRHRQQEWGGRLKYLWPGGDISLMLARLYGNQPVPVPAPTGIVGDVARYDLVGLSASVAYRRLLLKADLGYKTDQLLALREETADQLDLAMGFEYTTSGNHRLNGGIWHTRPMRVSSAPPEQYWLTAGWQKNFWHDNLALSALATWLKEPEQAGMTLLAEYQWDDYWRFSAALSVNDQESGTLMAMPDESLTLSVRLEI